jgi:hypothetical protein
MPTIRALARALLPGRTWEAWLAILTATFGLPLSDAELQLFATMTGRTCAPSSTSTRIRELWCIIGRRAGKSRIAALIAIYLTCCREYTLAPGETGVFMVIGADRRQARVIKRYISGFLRADPAFEALLADETADAITLTNGLVIEIHTASYRAIRSYTLIVPHLLRFVFGCLPYGNPDAVTSTFGSCPKNQ